MQPPSEAGLYGITQYNSTRFGKHLWGKNQFNSTFPLALCLYMRDHGHCPVAVIERTGQIVCDDRHWAMDDVIGAESVYYAFELGFEPYRQYMRNPEELDKIDLVVATDETPLRPLEIKLTVVPDNNTAAKKPVQWAPELVIRPVTSAYAMMSVARSVIGAEGSEPLVVRNVKSSLAVGYNKINDWLNPNEIKLNSDNLCDSLDRALQTIEAARLQAPFLLQPIWRTVGQSFVLHHQCFDVFAWSDVAVMRLPLSLLEDKSSVRALREVARHVRSLYDILTQGDYSYASIYKGMPLGAQTDKSFALGGTRSIRYLHHKRLQEPALASSVLNALIVGGGEGELKPERRFDAAVQQYMWSDTSH